MDVNGFQLSPESPYRTPVETLSLLVEELEAYQPTLLRSRRALLAVNKMDTPSAADALPKLSAAVEELTRKARFSSRPAIYPISAQRGDGLGELALALRQAVDRARQRRLQQSAATGSAPKSVVDHLYAYDVETAKYFREQTRRAHERVW